MVRAKILGILFRIYTCIASIFKGPLFIDEAIARNLRGKENSELVVVGRIASVINTYLRHYYGVDEARARKLAIDIATLIPSLIDTFTGVNTTDQKDKARETPFYT